MELLLIIKGQYRLQYELYTLHFGDINKFNTNIIVFFTSPSTPVCYMTNQAIDLVRGAHLTSKDCRCFLHGTVRIISGSRHQCGGRSPVVQGLVGRWGGRLDGLGPQPKHTACVFCTWLSHLEVLRPTGGRIFNTAGLHYSIWVKICWTAKSVSYFSTAASLQK